MGQHDVESVDLGAAPAARMVDGVDDGAEEMNAPSRQQFHRARLAHARLVVAVGIGAQRERGFVDLGPDQRLGLLMVVHRVGAAAEGAAHRRGLHPLGIGAHLHVGRGAEHPFAAAQVGEEHRRVGVVAAQPREGRGRIHLHRAAEGLRQHQRAQFAAAHQLHSARHRLRMAAAWQVVLEALQLHRLDAGLRAGPWRQRGEAELDPAPARFVGPQHALRQHQHQAAPAVVGQRLARAPGGSSRRPACRTGRRPGERMSNSASTRRSSASAGCGPAAAAGMSSSSRPCTAVEAGQRASGCAASARPVSPCGSTRSRGRRERS